MMSKPLGRIYGFKVIKSGVTNEEDSTPDSMDVRSFWFKGQRCVALITNEGTLCLDYDEARRLMTLLQEV